MGVADPIQEKNNPLLQKSSLHPLARGTLAGSPFYQGWHWKRCQLWRVLKPSICFTEGWSMVWQGLYLQKVWLKHKNIHANVIRYPKCEGWSRTATFYPFLPSVQNSSSHKLQVVDDDTSLSWVLQIYHLIQTQSKKKDIIKTSVAISNFAICILGLFYCVSVSRFNSIWDLSLSCVLINQKRKSMNLHVQCMLSTGFLDTLPRRKSLRTLKLKSSWWREGCALCLLKCVNKAPVLCNITKTHYPHFSCSACSQNTSFWQQWAKLKPFEPA